MVAVSDLRPIKAGLPPVVDTGTRVLVLGSLPGDRSLAEARYYAHPQNQFWRLIGTVIGRDLAPMPYPDRLAALAEARVGLWDVIGSATRTGSSDAAIRDEQVNNLVALVQGLTDLRMIGFNGGTAARLGTEALAGAAPHVERITLPSSSPLHTIGFAAKLPQWLVLKHALAG